MKLIDRLRAAWQRYRMGRAVRFLNEQASFFGFGPMSEEEWIAMLSRLGIAARSFGVSAEDAARGLNAIAVAQGLK